MISKILGVATLVLLATSGSLFFLWDSEKESRIQAEAQFKQLQATHNQMREDFEAQVDLNTQLNVELNRVQSERDMVSNQLNGYRDREKLLKRKPETIERLANAATVRLFDHIRSTTSRSGESDTSETSTDTDGQD